jgi:hypothetical protein
VPLAAILISAGFFFSVLPATATQPGGADRADLHGSGGAGGGGADVRGGIAEECWLGVPRLKPLLEKFLDYRSGEPLRHPKAEGIRSHLNNEAKEVRRRLPLRG